MNHVVRRTLLMVVALFAGAWWAAAADPPANVATSRPFLMGFTPMNFDDSAESTARMAGFLGKRAEVISIYGDNGIPWPEAFEDKPFPPAVIKRIEGNRKRIGPRHKVFLALNSIAMSRDRLTEYPGVNGKEPRPGKWADKDFDDPEIIEAYIKYAVRMIDTYRASYLAYGVEVSMLGMAKPATFDKFVVFAKAVYAKLKMQRPDVLIFPTFHADYHHLNRKRGEEIVRALLPYADAIAVSTYPYFNGHAAEAIPPGWFSDIAALAPNKPFIVAETAFIAEPYEGQFFNRKISVAATPQMQEQYVRRLLGDAAKLNALFVNWFFVEDLDAFWQKQTLPAARTMLMMWRDSGMLDEKFQPRPALAAWDQWLARPVSR